LSLCFSLIFEENTGENKQIVSDIMVLDVVVNRYY